MTLGERLFNGPTAIKRVVVTTYIAIQGLPKVVISSHGLSLHMHFRVGASSENPNVNSKRIFFNADLVRPHFALKLQFAAVFSLQHCTADSSTTGGNEKKMLEHEHVIGQLAIPLPTSLVAERDLLFAFLNTKCF